MYKIIIVVVLVCSVIVSSSSANNLPKILAGWKLSEEEHFPGQKLFDHINGGADIYYEYGFVQVHVGYYQKNDQEILVERYQMTDRMAAYGIHSITRDITAPELPSPYYGRIYDFYLDCIHGNDYIKIINYDTLSHEERMMILKSLIPDPVGPRGLKEIFSILPEKRIPGSEIIFRGALGVRNFCILGQEKIFDFGGSVQAAGCLIAVNSKKFRCVVLSGKQELLKTGLNALLSNIIKKDYKIKQQVPMILLEDTLSGDHIFILPRPGRINFVFNIPPSVAEKLVKRF